jgi:hypothetical protein
MSIHYTKIGSRAERERERNLTALLSRASLPVQYPKKNNKTKICITDFVLLLLFFFSTVRGVHRYPYSYRAPQTRTYVGQCTFYGAVEKFYAESIFCLRSPCTDDVRSAEARPTASTIHVVIISCVRARRREVPLLPLHNVGSYDRARTTFTVDWNISWRVVFV